jgi:uncharacterized membrane protein
MIYQLILLLFTLYGLLVSAFLVYKHYVKLPHVCPVGKSNCSDVTESKYAYILGMRNDILGLIFYVGVLALELAALYSSVVAPMMYPIICIGFAVGTLYSLWLIYVQRCILHSFCAYCLGLSTATIFAFLTVLKIISLYL